MRTHTLPELQAAYQHAHFADRHISLTLALANPYLRKELEHQADLDQQPTVQTSAQEAH